MYLQDSMSGRIIKAKAARIDEKSEARPGRTLQTGGATMRPRRFVGRRAQPNDDARLSDEERPMTDPLTIAALGEQERLRAPAARPAMLVQ